MYFVILGTLLQDMENMTIEVLYVWLEVTFQPKFSFIVLFIYVCGGRHQTQRLIAHAWQSLYHWVESQIRSTFWRI